MVRNIIKEIKQKKKGITGGAIFGAILVFYMKFTGAITQSALDPGLVDKVVTTVSVANMNFIKILIAAVLIGGLAGYILQTIMKK